MPPTERTPVIIQLYLRSLTGLWNGNYYTLSINTHYISSGVGVYTYCCSVYETGHCRQRKTPPNGFPDSALCPSETMAISSCISLSLFTYLFIYFKLHYLTRCYLYHLCGGFDVYMSLCSYLFPGFKSWLLTGLNTGDVLLFQLHTIYTIQFTDTDVHESCWSTPPHLHLSFHQ